MTRHSRESRGAASIDTTADAAKWSAFDRTLTAGVDATAHALKPAGRPLPRAFFSGQFHTYAAFGHYHLLVELGELYGLLPRLECKRLCAHSCKGVFEPGEDPCRHLSDGLCAIHEERPMICRLWGIDETMWCEHGCEPVGGHLPELVCVALLRAEERLTTGP